MSSKVLAILLTILSVAKPIFSADCQSDTYKFTSYVNPQELNLTTPGETVFLKFNVTNTKSVEKKDKNSYLDVVVQNDELIFKTSKQFEDYEKNEVDARIFLHLKFVCNDGEITGTFYQNVLLANNHAPKFTMETYQAVVPLPLPKGFDLTPFVDEGRGVVVEDYDLINNTVNFEISLNDFIRVEMVKLSTKKFQAVLKLKEQVLRLKEDLEVEVTGTDEGIPPKSGKAKVVIKPDLTIEYYDPPMFKNTFFRGDYNVAGNFFDCELIPATVHEEVQFSVIGEDKQFFEISVPSDKSMATVSLKDNFEPTEDVYFLTVIVEAKRGELQKAEAVILIDLKRTSANVTEEREPIETVLSVFELEEEKEHLNVFPAFVGERFYEIVSVTPNVSEEIFKVNRSSGWIVSSDFDREDPDLFKDVENPQFQLVLKLSESYQTMKKNEEPNFFDIPYSEDTTYLQIIVEDINDNKPIFTFPKAEQVFAFPVPRLAERLLLSNLLRVSAYDKDAGLNALIRYSLSSNDHFLIDPRTGIIRPLPDALNDEAGIDLEVHATDRNGSTDGLTTNLSIRIEPALHYQLSLLELQNMAYDHLESTIYDLEQATGVRLQVLNKDCRGVGISGTRQVENLVRLLVVAFDSNNTLLSTENFKAVLPNSDAFTVTSIEAILQDNPESEHCQAYGYVVVIAVFVVLFIAAAALAVFLWAKLKGAMAEMVALMPPTGGPSMPKVLSSEELIETQVERGCSTPPATKLMRSTDGVAADYTPADNVHRRHRLATNLSDLLMIEEHETESIDSTDSNLFDSETNLPRKSIRFNEGVERIEIKRQNSDV
ncbi:protocadherin gamma-A4-like [Uranotaenia lowii]|uniref:protocadherin gamma-A4-like n=1 Tax=Uranotaenia lowii TaxID=190385 RepID=UPI00247A48C0|nr:protocadherin gamma-A4-like [Uranotaenia lowii]